MSPDPRKPVSPPADIPEDVQSAWSAMDTDEPSALLDQAVLNRARAAVAPAPTKRPWSFGWLHTATTAAVIVLGVTLTLQLKDEAPGAGDPVPAAAPAEDAGAATPAADAVMERALRTAPAAAASAASADAKTATAEADEVIELDRVQISPAIAEEEPSDGAARQRNEMPAAAPIMERMSAPPPRDPEAWLEAIRQLVADGRLEDARVSLEAFQAAWPDYPIPEALIPEDLIPEDVIPGDPIPEDPIPEDSTPEDPTPEDRLP